MDLLQAIVIGLVQGLTEFLPVSSSGHLVLVPWVLGWKGPPLAFDVLLHVATLGAVVLFFRRDLARIVRGVVGRGKAEDRRLGWAIVIGTIPAGVAGVLLGDFFEELFSEPMAVGGFLLVTAALLTGAERLSHRRLGLDKISYRSGLFVGLAQAVAIAPGISRSGATMAMALALDFDRETAARFSFLLSIPVILGAGIVQFSGDTQLPALASAESVAWAVGAVAAFASGYAAIRFLLAFLRSRTLYPFAVYCALAGTAVLVSGALR